MDEAKLREDLRRNCENWQGYRLADAYMRPHWRDFPGRETLSEQMHRRFPRSIAGQYSLRNGFAAAPNAEILACVVRSMYDLKPSPGCVAHLRGGDVLSRSCREHRDRYTSPKEMARRIARDAKGPDVTLVTGSHYWSGVEATIEYAMAVADLLKRSGLSPTIQCQSPDEDFVTLVTASTLIPSRGGWMSLVRLIRPMLHT